jgi:hypothetical protein
MSDAGRNSSIRPTQFAPGTRVGRFAVVSSVPERLVLRGHIGASVLMIIGGLLLTFWGVFPWMALITGSDQSIPIIALFLAPGGLALIVGGIVQATLRYTFDGEQQSLICASRFRKPEVRSGRAFTHIAINVLPTNLDQRETVQLQLMQPGSEDTKILIGARRSNKKDALSLVLAGIEIARLLDHSIEVRGQCKEGSPSLLEALALASTIVRAPTPDDSQS